MPDIAYKNGVLPEPFARQAYIASSGQEFALPREAAIQYLQWCRSRGLRVLGLEVWQPTLPGPTPLVGVGCDGDADTCIAAIPEIEREHGAEVVFNIWVEERSDVAR